MRFDIFTKRGIDPDGDVFRERGYARYKTPDDVIAVDRRLEAFPNHLRKWCAEKPSGSPGWVMPKFHVPRSLWEDPIAQLRPDRAIRSWSHGHDHDGMMHVEKNCPCGIARHGEKALRHYQEALTGEGRRLHEEGKSHRDERGKRVKDPDTGKVIPTAGPHRHVGFAKYLLSPLSHGKRLDRHPRTDFTEHHERVFFVLEGTLKNDALVQRGEAAFNVPSVTLWHQDKLAGLDRYFLDEDIFQGFNVSPTDGYKALLENEPEAAGAAEIESFATQYLRDTPVVVVCDSDWHHNAEVATSALICRDMLVELGCPNVMVAAPPEGKVLFLRSEGTPARKKVGVDDMLNLRDPGDPDDLLIVDPQPGAGFERFAQDYRRAGRGKRHKDSLEGDIEFVRWLVKHSAATGEVKRPVPTVAKKLGPPGKPLSNRTVFKMTERLLEYGAITSSTGLAPVVEDRWRKVPNRTRLLNLGVGHAGATPIIVLREDLKPPIRPPFRVSDWQRSL